MTRLLAIVALMALVGAAGCARTPERRAAAGEWVGAPADADGNPIAPPTFYEPAPAPHVDRVMP